MTAVVRSMAAGGAAWVVPAVMSMSVFLSGPGVDSSGSPDNAPYRAAAFLLILSPIFIGLLSAYFFAVAYVLRRLGIMSLLSLVSVNLVLSLVIGWEFYGQGMVVGGAEDALFSFITFGLGAFICLGLGSVFWHWEASRTAV